MLGSVAEPITAQQNKSAKLCRINYSERNFVERAHDHVAENVALLRHGAFCSTKIHQKVEKHLENMKACS